MGGKNNIINKSSMQNLFINGSQSFNLINDSLSNLEETVAELRELGLSGEKGLICRQVLNSITVLTNDISRMLEKAAIYMEAKIYIKEPELQNEDNISQQNYSIIKR